MLSDLAPGLNLPAGKGYWTGMPLRLAKAYALMYTWLAPEMSRPGCVWTHALIISFADMARFADLSELMGQVQRPIIENGFDKYTIPLILTPATLTDEAPYPASMNVAGIRRVIRSIYSENGTGRLLAQPGELDGSIFSVWSQQWPRLRRIFSFRTAVSSAEVLTGKNEFMLTVQLGNEREVMNAAMNEDEPLEPWEIIANDNILKPHNTDYRRFLWRYGSDLRAGRTRFKFLTEIYSVTRSRPLRGEALWQVMNKIAKILPAADDGHMLKSDLVSGSKYSLLPFIDPIDLLAFYFGYPATSKLPPLSDEIFDAIHEGWESRSEEILAIAEIAVTQDSAQGEKFLDRLATVANPTTFLALTQDKPKLRRKFLLSTPTLLDSDDLIKINGKELLEFIAYIPDDDLALADRLLRRLLVIDDECIAREMIRRFSSSSVAAIVAAIEASCLHETSPVPNGWVNAFHGQSSLLLSGQVIEQSRSTAALAVFSAIFGFAQADVLHIDPVPWITGLKNARDNVCGYDRIRFLVFLLGLALKQPITGSEALFEISFETVHEKLRSGDLGWDLVGELSNFLPSIGCFSNWDYCLRLRIAVVDSYIKGKLDLRSFRRLANGNLFDILLDAAQNVPNGKNLLKQLKGK